MNSEKEKTIRIIPSKSYAHRAYICDFLAGGDGSDIICDLDSDDIRATRGCLEAIRTMIRATAESENSQDFLAVDTNKQRATDTDQLENGGSVYGVWKSRLIVISQQNPEHIVVLDCGESGSSLRFMLPLVGVLGISAEFVTKGRLSERPLGDFESELIRHGMEIEHAPGGIIKVSGSLTPGEYLLPGSISSQFITGLLLSLPFLDGDSTIKLTTDLQSSAYVDITIDVLRQFGIEIEKIRNEWKDTGSVISSDCGATAKCKVTGYMIRGGQRYRRDMPLVGPYVVEGDWSQAAFWLAAGAIGKAPVSVSGLNPESVQGDRRIVDVLREFGARIDISKIDTDSTDADRIGINKIDADAAEAETTDADKTDISKIGAGIEETVVTSYPSALSGTTIDVSEIPDLAPAIACAGAAASGETRLVNAGRLRLKESDRIRSIVQCLNDLGIFAREDEDEIIIQGCGGQTDGAGAECAGADDNDAECAGAECAGADDNDAECAGAECAGGRAETAGDHRIVMMAAVLSLIAKDKVTITGSGAVNKSYPTFFRELEQAGMSDNVMLEH